MNFYDASSPSMTIEKDLEFDPSAPLEFSIDLADPESAKEQEAVETEEVDELELDISSQLPPAPLPAEQKFALVSIPQAPPAPALSLIESPDERASKVSEPNVPTLDLGAVVSPHALPEVPALQTRAQISVTQRPAAHAEVPELQLNKRGASSIAPRASRAPPGQAPSQAARASNSPNTSSAASRSSRAPSDRSAPPHASLSNYPSMGGDLDLGEFDDLEFGAEASQLNVPLAEPQEISAAEAPWPTGRSPFVEDLHLDKQRALNISGFGPHPTHLWQAPIYAIQVRFALGKLRQKERLATGEVLALEDGRDRELAELAESRRPQLSKLDRFASLYSRIDEKNHEISEKQKALTNINAQGAASLRGAQSRLESLAAIKREKDLARSEREALLEESEKNAARAEAALQRVEIELRNLEARGQTAPSDPKNTAELESKERDLNNDHCSAENSLLAAQEERDQLLALLKAAEQASQIATANFQAHEAKREGLRSIHEGKLEEFAGSLEKSMASRQSKLADAARALLELKGQVDVNPATRKSLLAKDAAIFAATVERETLRLALSSRDIDKYNAGRNFWILLLCGLLVILALSLFG